MKAENIIQINDSKAIKALGYNEATKTLYVKFADSPMYSYMNVPSDVFITFLNHPKKGSFFKQIEKSLGQFKRLDN